MPVKERKKFIFTCDFYDQKTFKICAYWLKLKWNVNRFGKIFEKYGYAIM